MRRIRALLAVCFEPPTLLKKRQHGVQQQLFGVPGKQACSEFGKDGMIKTGVAEFQAKGILEVDASSHRIGGLAIGKSFGKLHHGDQR